MQNWLDEAIGFFAPGVAVKRAKRRAQLSAFRDYAGAALGRHTDGWKARSTSADTEIYSGGRRLRDRARDLVRNNPHAAKAVSVFSTNLIGDGIMPRPDTGSDRRDKKIKRAFDRWCEQCDADGQLDFYGIQTLAVREMVEGGEVLARRRWRLSSDGYTIPVQVQLLEADYLADWRHGLLPNGSREIQGVAFNAIGKRTGYWMCADHPGNNFGTGAGFAASFVPASDIAHLYEKQRTQARGVSWFAPVVRRIRDADDWNFAEGIRKKIEASAVAFVTSGDDMDQGLAASTDGTPQIVDAAGNLIERFSPGLIGYLRGGKDVKFNAPATIGGVEEYNRVSARDVATGVRIPYELLSGDLSNVNFSSARVGIVEFRRFCSAVQWQIIVPMLLAPLWRWFCEAAFLAGEIDAIDIPVKWSMPKWEAIQPLQDAQADLILMRSGQRSPQDVIAARGYNPVDVLDEVAAWNAMLDAKKIVLDSDPRKTALKGAIQSGVTSPAADGDNQSSVDRAN